MKKLLKLALAGALAILPSTIAQAQTDITWWDFLSGGDGVRMKALIKEFNETHPDIRINATTLEWGVPFYSKVQTAAAVGQQPDIMTYHLSRFPLAIPSGVLRPLAPEELEAAGIKKENYVEASWNSASADGKVYGVPFDVHSVVLYYNKNILKEAGLLGDDGLPKGLEGLDNFNAALEKVKATGKVQYPLSLHTDEGGSMWRVFYTLLAQQGAKFIDGDEILPGDAGVKALSAMANWVSSGYSPELISYEASIALFTSGKAAMHINGVWEVPTMVDLEKNGNLGFEWGAIQIPALMGQPATWADSHAFAVPNSEEKPISREAEGGSPDHRLDERAQHFLGGRRAYTGLQAGDRKRGVQSHAAEFDLRQACRYCGLRPGLDTGGRRRSDLRGDAELHRPGLERPARSGGRHRTGA